LYYVVKARAYGLAQIVAGRSNADAAREGFRDVFDLLMSDSDHPRQQQFLLQLPNHFTEEHRQVLLDGLAQEYASLDGWSAYVDKETG
jgi:HEAT repeat protein